MYAIYEKFTSILALFAWARSSTPKRSAMALAKIHRKHRPNPHSKAAIS